MSDWKSIPSDDVILKTIEALGKNNISAEIVNTKEEAKQKALSLIPENAEVMTMQSMTLREVGIFDAIDESGKYNSIRKKLSGMDRATQGLEMQKLGAAPEYTFGSVHAVTEEGHVIIASNTGSQLPAYTYTSPHVTWIVGAQKIVKNVDAGLQRIHEYILPLESQRLATQFGNPDFKSNDSKILLIRKEVNPTRLHIIFVKEVLGF